ncbi:hypothetical protein [Ancylobacter terrae]|uniref:hypothetical protein n=1 Tax=Ancylobacter sp. sgz301288 TaxID=3342077 RepID=UPI00385AA9F4
MNTVQMNSTRTTFVGQAAAWLFSAFDHRTAEEAPVARTLDDDAWTFNTAAAGAPMVSRPRSRPSPVDAEALQSAERMIASIHRRAASAALV